MVCNIQYFDPNNQLYYDSICTHQKIVNLNKQNLPNQNYQMFSIPLIMTPAWHIKIVKYTPMFPTAFDFGILASFQLGYLVMN